MLAQNDTTIENFVYVDTVIFVLVVAIAIWPNEIRQKSIILVICRVWKMRGFGNNDYITCNFSKAIGKGKEN